MQSICIIVSKILKYENKVMTSKIINYAIYFIAVSDGAIKCLEFSYSSLRRAGFVGDIYIMSTRSKLPFSTDENTFLKTILNEDMNLDLNAKTPIATVDVRRLDAKNPRNIRMSEKFVVCHGKTLADKYIQINKYDYLVYLDSDILVMGDLKILESFLDSNQGKIITATNRTKYLGEWPFFISPMWFSKGALTSNLSKTELFLNWHKQPLCADIVCFPTGDFGQKFLFNWRRECQKGIDQDQAALQALMLRAYKDDHVLAPYNLFGYGPSAQAYAKNGKLEKVDSVFVHFHSAVNNPTVMEKYFETYGNF
jgi:hypothetical protein